MTPEQIGELTSTNFDRLFPKLQAS